MGLLSRAEEILQKQYCDKATDEMGKVFRDAYDRVHEAIMAPAPEYYPGLFALKEIDGGIVE